MPKAKLPRIPDGLVERNIPLRLVTAPSRHITDPKRL
jgi:hypothetical protein